MICEECEKEKERLWEKQKVCVECRKKHNLKEIFSKRLGDNVGIDGTVWKCVECGKLFYGGL